MKSRVGRAAAQSNRGVGLESERAAGVDSTASWCLQCLQGWGFLSEGRGDAEGHLDYMEPHLSHRPPCQLGTEAGGCPADAGHVTSKPCEARSGGECLQEPGRSSVENTNCTK